MFGNTRFLLLLPALLFFSNALALEPSRQDERAKGIIVQFADNVISCDSASTGLLTSNMINDNSISSILMDNGAEYIRNTFANTKASVYKNGSFKQLPSFSNTYLILLEDDGDVSDVVAALNESPLVQYAEPNQLLFEFNDCTDPDDYYYDQGDSSQWWLSGPDSISINITP